MFLFQQMGNKSCKGYVEIETTDNKILKISHGLTKTKKHTILTSQFQTAYNVTKQILNSPFFNNRGGFRIYELSRPVPNTRQRILTGHEMMINVINEKDKNWKPAKELDAVIANALCFGEEGMVLSIGDLRARFLFDTRKPLMVQYILLGEPNSQGYQKLIKKHEGTAEAFLTKVLDSLKPKTKTIQIQETQKVNDVDQAINDWANEVQNKLQSNELNPNRVEKYTEDTQIKAIKNDDLLVEDYDKVQTNKEKEKEKELLLRKWDKIDAKGVSEYTIGRLPVFKQEKNVKKGKELITRKWDDRNNEYTVNRKTEAIPNISTAIQYNLGEIGQYKYGGNDSKVEAWSAIAALFAVTVCAAVAGTSV